MTREEFEQYAKENGLVVWSKEMAEKALKALEQETCKTCVYYCPDGYCRHSSLTIAEVEQ